MRLPLFLYTLLWILSFGSPAFSLEGEDPSRDHSILAREKACGPAHLFFVENQGQLDDDVHFYAPGLDKTLYFTSQGLTLALEEKGGTCTRRWALKLGFVGADSGVKPSGEDPKDAVFSYFRGEPGDWKVGVPTYGRLVYNNLWPGIDLVYRGTEHRLKYELIVKPGADPACIRFFYEGASRVTVEATGALRVVTPLGDLEDGIPRAFQWIEGERKVVAATFQVQEESGLSGFQYGFRLGDYDPDHPLILDPALLVYCGFIGGGQEDEGHGMAVDASGRLYITGIASSSETDFPVKAGPDLTYNGGFNDAFVARLNGDGTDLEYCGYIGGDDDDWGFAVAVDSDSCAYVTGFTRSSESTFPVKNGPSLSYQWEDAFVAKVNGDGTDLEYCGYIGGSSVDMGRGIAVDDESRAYVIGTTTSTESSLPVKTGPDLSYNGGFGDAFVARVIASGVDLEYCGYIGGDSMDSGYSIAVDSQGSAYVTGDTQSGASSFPVKTGPVLSYGGNWDGFVAKVNPTGAHLDYCGYIGGDDMDKGYAVAVDMGDRAYVAGETMSDPSSFPVKVGPDLSFNGSGGLPPRGDAFVARVNAQGTDFDYCGYIGGSEGEGARGVAVDTEGRAYVAGWTRSVESTFPVKGGPGFVYMGSGSTFAEWGDAFVARVNLLGTDLDYCGYIGGAEDDVAFGIGVDGCGHAYLAGLTFSDEMSFPTTTGPDLSHNGEGDAFAAKVVYRSLVADTYTLSAGQGGTVNFALDGGSINGNRTCLLLGSLSGTDPGTPLPGGQTTLPLNMDGFTNTVITLINTSMFWNFLALLDGSGCGFAQLNSMGPITPGAVGVELYFAYALHGPWDFVSNPINVEIVP